MNWIEKLNDAVLYIEEHITEQLDYVECARIACCSSYHFQLIFTYLADISLSEYIRRRKMSLAAVDLQSGTEKIIDIALKYGYSSPTAFNRAFQSVHGIAPSLARKSGVPLKSFPPISFKMAVKGVYEMNFRIEKKDAFRIVGVSEPLDSELEKNFEIVPKMWEKATTSGLASKLSAMMDTPLKGVLGVSVCYDEKRGELQEYSNWRYFIAVPTTLPAGELEEYIVPALTWAVFPGKGTYSYDLPNLERRIITEWMPTSGYEYDNGPDIEVYLSDNTDNAEFEIWIPVRRRR